MKRSLNLHVKRKCTLDDLIRILDSEIRLITPTDPEGKDADDNSVTQTQAGQKYFQLTHDYLVHSLRDWLTRKQKETRKGRAELKLFDTSVTWNAKPENRFLPSWWEHLTIRLLTDRKKWTEPQRKMMGNAGRVYGIRSLLVAVLLVGVTIAGVSVRSAIVEERFRTQAQVKEKENTTRADELVASLLKADIAQVPVIISDLKEFREWAEGLLKARISEAEDGSAEKLHLALALLPVDEGQIEYLRDQLPVCSLTQFPVLREALLPHKEKLTDALWQVATDEQRDAAQRFQAAGALAEYAPEDERWQATAPFVVQYLTSAVSPVYLGQWRELLQPASEQLAGPLAAIHADRSDSERKREATAFILSDYLRDQPDKLVDAILLADEFAEFSPLIAALKPQATKVREQLRDEMQAAMPVELDKTNNQLSEADQQLRDNHWSCQSLAAVALVQLGFGDEVWSVLEFTPNPSLRSYIIHHLGKLGTDHNTLAARLQIETEVSIRCALVQSLGGLNGAMLPASDRNLIAEQLKSLYVTDLDSGIHGSASWTLRQWGETLPELLVGEPTLSDEQKVRIAKLAAEVDTIRQPIITDEQVGLPVRQAAWERQLREQSATLPAPLSEGLVAHYPLDEIEGIEAANAVNGQPNGVYAGPGEPEWVPGVMGHAVRLNGNGGHFTCGEAFNPERTDSFSYGCWFLSEDDTRYATLLAKRDDNVNGGRGFDLWFEVGRIGTHLIHAESLDNRVKVLSADPVSGGRWRHVMVTYEGSSTAGGVTLYVDGRIVRKTSVSNRLSDTIQNNVPLHIGMRKSDAPFRGRIDDVRIYNRRLSDKEVQQLFESGVRSLAGFPAETRTPEQQALLTGTYRTKDEPLSRLESQLAAAEMALREARREGVGRWYVNGQGQTMVEIPNPAESNNGPIDHNFAIASHEVTVAEFRRFRDQHRVDSSTAPTEDCPVHHVSWYDATAYCNWLSQQEGIPEDQWVYEPNGEGQYAEGMKIKENADELTGYRLPTEAEWEFACRAGSSGSYGFGEPVSLLKRYARLPINSSGRSDSVESLLPNAVGLFDMHGNLWEWTQNPISASMSPISNNVGRVCRGGSFGYNASTVRSANRLSNQPDNRDVNVGFRVGRTLILVPLTALPPAAGGSKFEN